MTRVGDRLGPTTLAPCPCRCASWTSTCSSAAKRLAYPRYTHPGVGNCEDLSLIHHLTHTHPTPHHRKCRWNISKFVALPFAEECSPEDRTRLLEYRRWGWGVIVVVVVIVVAVIVVVVVAIVGKEVAVMVV